MELVFIRHALAQERSELISDAERELVARGEKQSAQAARVLQRKLGKKQKIILLSSPAARAIQTARLIAKGLGLQGIDGIHECIYTGDTQTLIEVLRAQPKDSAVLVVGHEPDLSHWAQLLSGQEMRFKKSGMAGFMIKGRNIKKARLRWSYRAPMMNRVPDKKAKKDYFTVSMFQNLMLHRVLAIHEARANFLKQPQKARTVHNLRISLRQTRSLLSFMRPILDGDEYMNSQHVLRLMSRSLSRARELDVFIKRWASHIKKHGDEYDSPPLAEALRKERHHAMDLAIAHINNEQLEKDLEAVLNWVDQWDLRLGRDTSLKDAAQKRLRGWNKTINKGIMALNVQDLPGTHALRLRIKKARYAQESIPLLQAGKGLDAERLKQLQEDLGDICDTHAHQEVLEELLKAHAISGSDEGIRRFIDDLETTRDALNKKLNP